MRNTRIRLRFRPENKMENLRVMRKNVPLSFFLTIYALFEK